ncbi:hypothetical protein ASPWEDRAFT_32980 [Aspergillus wentii DTO 134E9]|uniref:Uncharacterized protein n=1 Tax=Aspergillus wentii DTO 134E9 TaxID=1073089 RepID=A0A1L9R4C6_ASPWE|nr:uncharacterized protein ASPWEDRAFT_32980 [Aspergillus wentii DTO 134E9]OJJ29742.1 hypothetical protein ASPWEDRAFT_32980 [Aspergillus wentii DTO 134E9]
MSSRYYIINHVDRTSSSDIERKCLLKDLRTIFWAVEEPQEPFMEEEDILRLNLEVKALDMTGDTSTVPEFFKPLPREKLQMHPTAEDEETRCRLNGLKNIMTTPVSSAITVLTPSAAILRGNFVSLADSYRGFSYALFKEQNMDTIFIEPSHTFNPAGAWEVKGKYKHKPHLIFTMKHDIIGDVRLLRGEVLAIIAALRSRLVPDMFKEHLVIPAYHDGQNLLLRKSPLFDFSRYEIAPFDLFVRHLASEPVEEIRMFPKQHQQLLCVHREAWLSNSLCQEGKKTDDQELKILSDHPGSDMI